MKFICRHCLKEIVAGPEKALSEIPCPTCGAPVLVPDPSFALGKMIGGFRLKALLGKGGMAEVYLATQVAMDRDVALKIVPRSAVPDEPQVRRFLNEVRLAAKLNHPSIVAAFEAGEEPDGYFLAMSYIPGDSLRDRLDRGGPMEEKQALLVVRKIADALDYAWETNQLLHRDVKPSNILFDSSGEPKLTDFGLSKSLLESGNLTIRTTAIGTPNYMSPELAQGRKDADLRSDMYSLGATLYHMLTGKMPFKCDSVIETLRRQIMDPLPDPRGYNRAISEPCVALLNIMAAKDPGDRHATWAGLVADIDRVLAGAAPTGFAPPPGRSGAARGSGSVGKRRSRARLAAALAAGIALFAMAFAAVRFAKRPLAQRYEARLEAAMRRLAAANSVAQLNRFVEMSDAGIRLDLSANPELRDLAPLAGLPLDALDVSHTAVFDLSPLAGMRLRDLNIRNTHVDDLSPLRGMPLERLNLTHCSYVNDLSALSGLPLQRLESAFVPIASLAPLARSPLTELDVSDSAVADLSPLTGLPLNRLAIAGTRVTDLAPISRAPMRVLDISRTHVDDLRPLKDLQLEELNISDCYLVRDLGPLARVPLRRLFASGVQIDSLEGIQSRGLQIVNLWQSRISDLSALRGAPLERLDLAECGFLLDLTPLHGLPLKWLNLWKTRVSDLGPLRGSPLGHLDLTGCSNVTNLEPLAGMPLVSLNLSGCARISSLDPLNGCRLREIDVRGCDGITNFAPLFAITTLTNVLMDPQRSQGVP